MKNPLKIAVLISGSGSNLQSLIDFFAKYEGKIDAKIELVLSNKKDVLGLKRAEQAGIKTSIIENKQFKNRSKFDKAMLEELSNHNIDFIVLAGFMRILTADFISHWQGRIINIHPSLLPSFKGTTAHKDALQAGVKLSGCTVHHVVPEVDSGKIIAQAVCKIEEEDDEAKLQTRIKKLEHICLPLALIKVISPNFFDMIYSSEAKKIIEHGGLISF